MTPVDRGADELLTPGGVAALLYVDPKTVTRWALTGKLDAIRTPGGHRRYRKADVLAILAGDLPGVRVPGPAGSDAPTSPRATAEVGALPRQHRQEAASVVAEAVAVAREQVELQVTAQALATRAEVEQAAGRAAEATRQARVARQVATGDLARRTAVEAVRTATRVQGRADAASTQLRRAAALAAEVIADPPDGAVPDAREAARQMAETVLAAARLAAAATREAARTVAVAVDAAAVDAARAAGAAEVAFAESADAPLRGSTPGRRPARSG